MPAITVRDVDENLLAEIGKTAEQSGARSREAFLRDFLLKHFAGSISTGISGRLRAFLDDMIALGTDYKLSPPPTIARLAANIGHPDVAQLELQYRGDIPVKFDDGKRLCDIFGLDPDWLFDERASRFGQRPKYDRPEGLNRAFYLDGIPYRYVHIVLEDAERGEALVFGQHENSYRWELLLSDVPIHDDIGGGGESMLKEFCYFLALHVYLHNADHNLLKSRGTPNGGFVSFFGSQLPSALYQDLQYGRVHPAAILHNNSRFNSKWHEDLPDLEYDHNSYTSNYQRAKARFRSLMGDRTKNWEVISRIRDTRLKQWQMTKYDVAAMLSQQATEQGLTLGHESARAICDDAEAGDELAIKKILIAWDRCTAPVPFWLGWHYAISGEPTNALGTPNA